MSEKKSKSGTKVWLAVGVVVLIILLFLWLTIADFFGDTDVAAAVLPLAALG